MVNTFQPKTGNNFMTNLITKDFKTETGLQLISTDNFIGLAYMNILLEHNTTIKEYKKWERGNLYNVISVKDPHLTPQILYKTSIKEIHTVHLIAKDKLKVFNSLQEKDVLTPFGIKSNNFSALLTKLWVVESDDHYDYVREIQKHYKQIFESIKKDKK